MADTTRCVGRSGEKELLGEFVTRAIAGDQQLILLEGEAGAGKTALLMEFAEEQARNRQVRALYLRPTQGETYQPVHHAALASTNQRLYRRIGGRRQATEVARSVYLDWLGAIPVVGNLIAAILATVERVRRKQGSDLVPSGTSLDEDIEALLVASRRKPLVLLLDDLHLADPVEVGRLEKLICVADANAHILIVGAYRPAPPGTPQPPIKRLLTTLPTAQELFQWRRLAPLASSDLREWVEQSFPGAIVPASFLERLQEATGGHPGSVSEALADLQFRQSIRREGGRWQIAAESVIPVLQSASGASADLGSLPAEVTEILRAASVLGAEFDGGSLARLLQADELEIEDRLAAAVHLGLLEQSGEAILEDGDIITSYRFKSPQIVPALRESAPPELRAAAATVNPPAAR